MTTGEKKSRVRRSQYFPLDIATIRFGDNETVGNRTLLFLVMMHYTQFNCMCFFITAKNAFSIVNITNVVETI